MLIPAAVQNLNDSHTPFDHAAGQQSTGGKTSRLLHCGAVEVECLSGFPGQVHKVRYAALHPKRHLVLGDSCGGFRVGKFLTGQLIQLVQ